jgi:hypothetical protein
VTILSGTPEVLDASLENGSRLASSPSLDNLEFEEELRVPLPSGDLILLSDALPSIFPLVETISLMLVSLNVTRLPCMFLKLCLQAESASILE